MWRPSASRSPPPFQRTSTSLAFGNASSKTSPKCVHGLGGAPLLHSNHPELEPGGFPLGCPLQDDPGVRALQCGNTLAYRTAIPDDSVGILFGTLEKPFGEGIMGITSLSNSQNGDIPEVDVSIFEC